MSEDHSYLLSQDQDQDMTGEGEGGDAILEKYINKSDLNQTLLVLFILAMGNAADAIEIICVGFIMTEMTDIDQHDKEFLSAAVFVGMVDYCYYRYKQQLL